MASALGVLIIPGSFSYSSYYYDVVDRIKRDGYDAYVANLPSVIREPPESPATLSDDANHIRNIISTLAEQGKDVIVLAHSYGGVVASQAVSGVLKTDREAIGLLGGVVRLVYLTATVMPEGLSMDEYIRRPEGLFTTSTEGYSRVAAIDIISKTAFHDMNPEMAAGFIKVMPSHSAASFASPLTHAGYKYVPCTYIFCENDGLVVPKKQVEYIDRIRNESGRAVDVFNLSSGHVPHLTEPEKLVEIIAKIVSANH